MLALYADAMSGYIAWMTPQLAAVQAKARELFERYRQKAQRPGLHARTPGIIAQLYTKPRAFRSEYAREGNCKALSGSEADDILAKGWNARERRRGQDPSPPRSALLTQQKYILLAYPRRA